MKIKRLLLVRPLPVKCLSLTMVLFFVFALGQSFVSAQVYEWSKNIGGPGFDIGEALTSDAQGNVYVTGSFEETTDFDPGPNAALLTAETEGDIFVAKYDAAGNYVWAIKIGSKDYEYSLGIDVDKSGNTYVTGYFDGATDFDPDTGTVTLTPSGSNDVFLAKYDANGKYLWAISMGGSRSDNGAGVKVDTTGNVYVTGYYNSDSADFDPSPNTAILKRVVNNNNNNYDVFVAKYDPDGNYLWAISMGGTATDYAYAIDVDAEGNSYITGTYNSVTADFNPGSDTAILRRVGSNDIFVAKYDTKGNYVWAINIGGSGLDQGRAIAVDANSNVYVAGHFASALVDFDPGADTSKPRLRTKGSDDIFIAKYDSSGKYVWARNAGGSSVDMCYGMDVNAIGDVIITGYYNGEADFDGITGSTILKATGGTAMYLARYDTDGNFKWAGNIDGSGTSYGVATNKRGDIYITGYFYGTVDFNPGPDVDTLNTTGFNFNVFVAKFICIDTTSSYLQAEECRESYILNGVEYKEAGIYTQHFANATGCDSTLVIELSFYEIKPEITTDGFVLGVESDYASYQWIKDDTDIPGATDATYTATENGEYQVSVVSERGCEGISDIYRVTNVPGGNTNNVGIENYIAVYPNPANDVLHINSPVHVNPSLLTIEGRKILYRENAKDIPLERLSDGLYLLWITDINGNLIKVEKVVKKQ